MAIGEAVDQGPGDHNEKIPLDLQAMQPEKHDLILQACRDRDVPTLTELADSEGGLLEDELRRDACEEGIAPLAVHAS